MAKTDPLDPNVPAGSESPRMGDDRIKELARAVAELLNVDHYMGSDGGAGTGYNEDAAGEHKQVTINAPISTPSNEANKLKVYGKDVNDKIEFFVLDEDGNEIQLTSAGKVYASNLLMPSGGVAQIETIQAVDETGVVIKNDSGDTVITAGDDGKATLADGSLLAAATEAGDDDRTIADKAYADAAPAAQMTPTSMTGGNESNGTVTLPNGLIMKWGDKSVANSATISFATETGSAFPNNCFQVIGTKGSGGTWAGGTTIDNISNASFDIDWGGVATFVLRWFAIGR